MRNRDSFFLFPLRLAALAALLALPCAVSAQSIPALDPGFQPVITHAGGTITAAALQPDGKLIVAGAFNAINGAIRNGIARLNADGSVDASSDPGAGACCGSALFAGSPSAPVTALLIQRDGRILLGGSFSTVGGQPRKGLARLDAGGKLDTGFDPGTGLSLGNGGLSGVSVTAFAEQTDGKLLLGGTFTAINGLPRSGVARLNANGSVDTAFNPGAGVPVDGISPGSGRVNALALLSSGQVLIAGTFGVFDTADKIALARLNANGRLDTAFDVYFRPQDGAVAIERMILQPDGKVVINGAFSAVQDDFRDNLARLNPDGTVDQSFAPAVDIAGGESFTVLGADAAGRVIAFRQFTDSQGTSRRVLARLNKDGSVDDSFSIHLGTGSGNRLQVATALRQADGKWIAAGDFTAGTGTPHAALVRASDQGAVDEAFQPRLEIAEDLASNLRTFAAQKDGGVLIGGVFDRVNGTPRKLLARLSPTGTLDSSFTPNIETADPQSSVSAIAIQDDGKIVIGGVFRTVNSANRNGLARLNSDGTLDTSFDPGSGTNEKNVTGSDVVGRVSAIAVQPDGKILIGGDFNVVRDLPGSAWLARLNADGSFDSGFQPNLKPCLDCTPPDVRGILVLKDGRIVIHGIFDRVEGSGYHGLARLNPDGGLDPSLAALTSANDEVQSVSAASDGSFVAAVASADSATGTARTRLLRFRVDGSADTAFAPGDLLGDDPSVPPVSAIAFDAGGRLVIGGQLASVAGKPRAGLARFTADGTLDETFSASASFARGVLASPRGILPLLVGLIVQDDGSILAGGGFGVAGGSPRTGLARFLADAPTGGGGGGGSKPKILSATRGADGRVSLSVAAEAGRTFRVEASADLKNWSNIGTVTGAASPATFTDSAARDLALRFYRLRAE